MDSGLFSEYGQFLFMTKPITHYYYIDCLLTEIYLSSISTSFFIEMMSYVIIIIYNIIIFCKQRFILNESDV